MPVINYIPIAYNGESFKQEMQTAVVQGMALPPSAGDPVKVTKARIEKLIRSNDAPSDAFIEVKLAKKVIQARVAYTQTSRFAALWNLQLSI